MLFPLLLCCLYSYNPEWNISRSSFSLDYFSSQPEEEWEFQIEINMRLRGVLESKRQTMETQEDVSYCQSEENERLNLEMENKKQKIEALKNVYIAMRRK